MADKLLALLILASAVALTLPGCRRGGGVPGTVTVTIKGETFHLEPAVDAASREQGMMHRASIAEDGGMLFVFPDAEVRSFWMGHCLVDIDIMFLDAHGRVTATHRMKAQPPQADGESDLEYELRMPRYPSVYPAQFAIELKEGSLDRLGVRVEDKIPLDLPRLKAMAR